MSQDRKAELLSRIGAKLQANQRFSAAGTLFICAVEDMFISMSLFWNRGNYIIYNSPDYDEFEDVMFELWELDAPGKRWLEMEYLLRGKKFEANFLYEEDIGDELMNPSRISDSARRYLGDKEIMYPDDLGDDTFEL